VWGCRKERAQAPIRNEKRKQTYFGALNAKTQKTTVKSSPTGNSENTIDFLETLRWQHPDQKIVVIWEGATSPRSQQLRNYLSSINSHSSPESIDCFRLAPNALRSKSS
ncbi:MAG: IS630 family transposase, partial [Cyanobacteria bacterium QH_7_48_89]